MQIQSTEQTSEEPIIASNMAELYKDRVKKHLCTLNRVPSAIRETVEQLLAGGD